IYFRAGFSADDIIVSKLFKTDGTPGGTKEVTLNGFKSIGGGPLFFRGQLLLGLEDPNISTELFGIVLDACPDDPAKISLGACGCGVADTDTDNNGTIDCLTNLQLKLLSS